MAYDYDGDILAGLWTGIEDTEEPYASFIASLAADLTDDDAEKRILCTIELLRSHMELIGSRTEGSVLKVTLARLMRGAGSGGFVYDLNPITVTGNICNPTFDAGASVEVTTATAVINAVTASGGDIDTVVPELNATMLIPAVAEVTDILCEADLTGSRGGTYFTINSAGDATAYYAWLSHSGAAEVTTFSMEGVGGDVDGSRGGQYFTINSATDATAYYVWLSNSGAAEVTSVVFNTADVGGNQGGNYFTLKSAADATAYYAWMSHPSAAEVTDFTFNTADVGGNQGGNYFTLNSALDGTAYYAWLSHPGIEEATLITVNDADTGGSEGGQYFTINSAGDATGYYVWLSHPGLAEATSVTSNNADVGGSRGGLYFTINSAGDGTAYYVWLSHPGLPEITSVTSTIADVAGSLGGTYFTLSSAADATDYYAWLSHPATSGFDDATNGSKLGAYATLAATATYDFDVVIDGGVPQLLAVGITVSDTYATIASKMSAVPVVGGTVSYDDTTMAFRVTSTATGATSTVALTDGTFGSGGGPLFAALDAADTVVHAFPAGTPGVDAAVDPAPVGPTAIPCVYAVNDSAAAIAVVIRTAIGALGDFGTSVGNPFTITNAASGVTTDSVDVDTGLTITTTQDGIAAAADPTPGGTAIPAVYAVGDTAAAIATATQTAIDGVGDFDAEAGGNPFTVTNVAVGATTDAADVDTEFTISVTTQGLAAASDPTPGGTAIPAVYAVGDTAATIATAVRTAIDGVGDFDAEAPGNPFTVTNTAAGATTDAVDVDSGVSISVTAQGLDAATDPTPGGTGIPILYAIGDGTPAIAAACITAIDAVIDFGAAGAGSTCTVTNAAIGATTDAADVDTEASVTVTTQGIAAAVDPSPGGTGIPIVYAVNDGTGAIAIAARSAIGALGDFSTGGAESTCIVTNAAVGATTDAADVDTEATITVTTQGVTVAVDPAPGGLTAIPALYSVGDSESEINIAVRTAVDGNGDFSAFDVAPVVITNAAVGATTDAADVDTEAAIVTTFDGIAASSDPTPGGTGIAIVYTVGASAGTMATAVSAAIGALGDFSSEVTISPTVAVTNTALGATTDAADVDTEFAIAISTQGSDPTMAEVEAFSTTTKKLCFRNRVGFELEPFSLAPGVPGGVLKSAGIEEALYPSKPDTVAGTHRNDALNVYKGFKRDPDLP